MMLRTMRLDGSDPINRGLLAFLPLNMAGMAGRDIGPRQQDFSVFGTASTQVIAPNPVNSRAIKLTSSYLVRSTFDIPAASAFTFTAWVNAPNGTGYLFDSTSRSGTTVLHAHVPFSGTAYFRYGGYSNELTANYSAYLDKWTHVAFICNGVNFMAMCINGNVVASRTTINTLAAITTLQLGTGSNSAIAGARILNRALHISEIRRLYREPFAGVALPTPYRYNLPGTPAAEDFIPRVIFM